MELNHLYEIIMSPVIFQDLYDTSLDVVVRSGNQAAHNLLDEKAYEIMNRLFEINDKIDYTYRDELIEQLLKALENCKKPVIRATLAQCVGLVGMYTQKKTQLFLDSGAIAELIKLLSCPNEVIRIAALQAMDYLVQGKPEIRNAALSAGLLDKVMDIELRKIGTNNLHCFSDLYRSLVDSNKSLNYRATRQIIRGLVNFLDEGRYTNRSLRLTFKTIDALLKKGSSEEKLVAESSLVEKMQNLLEIENSDNQNYVKELIDKITKIRRKDGFIRCEI